LSRAWAMSCIAYLEAGTLPENSTVLGPDDGTRAEPDHEVSLCGCRQGNGGA
jgi:hypothetical protein